MGTPRSDSAGLSGVGKGYIEKPADVRRGSGKAAAMALRAVCSGIGIQDSNQNKTVPKVLMMLSAPTICESTTNRPCQTASFWQAGQPRDRQPPPH